MTTAAASTPSSSELSDYESSSSLEIRMSPMKLREKLAQELEEEKKTSAKTRDPTNNGDSALQNGNDGKVRSARILRLESIIKARKMMRAKIIQNLNEHLQKPHVRRAYDVFRRDLPPEIDLCSARTRKKMIISAYEDRLCVKIERRPTPPQ